MRRVVEVIEGALDHNLNTELLREVLGLASTDPLPKYLPQPPIVTTLDTVARAGAPDASHDARDALWAALRGLPQILNDLALSLYGSALTTDGPDSIFEHLRRMLEEPRASANSEYRCPRCGSRQVDCHRDKTLGVVSFDIKCERCGLSSFFQVGDPEEDIWIGRSTQQ